MIPICFTGFGGHASTITGIYLLHFEIIRDTVPHEGYSIVKSWKEEFFSKSTVAELFKNKWKEICDFEDDSPLGIPGPFFVYTSNVNRSIWLNNIGGSSQ